jgi:H/ACA ribonucleoprotein complex non-core subunit NAF1
VHLQNDLPPIEHLQIQVNEQECLELGTITSIVDQLVLVEAYPHSAALDIDSILFLNHGQKVLGSIFDVLGPVSSPIYCVRFNSHDEIVEKEINIGAKVFCAPRTPYTSFVILSNIMKKGSDASWKNDVEPPTNLIEYSDDEQERKSRRHSQHNENNTQFRRKRENYSWHSNLHVPQTSNNNNL